MSGGSRGASAATLEAEVRWRRTNSHSVNPTPAGHSVVQCHQWRSRRSPSTGSRTGTRRVGMSFINTDGLSFIGPGSEWFWTAFQGVIVALTLWGLLRQVRIQTAQKMRQDVTDLSGQWQSERMLRHRLTLATALTDGTSEESAGGGRPPCDQRLLGGAGSARARQTPRPANDVGSIGRSLLLVMARFRAVCPSHSTGICQGRLLLRLGMAGPGDCADRANHGTFIRTAAQPGCDGQDAPGSDRP